MGVDVLGRVDGQSILVDSVIDRIFQAGFLRGLAVSHPSMLGGDQRICATGAEFDQCVEDPGETPSEHLPRCWPTGKVPSETG